MGFVEQRSGVLKVTIGVIAMCLAGYIVGPPLYWHFMEAVAAITHSPSSSSYSSSYYNYYYCSPCVCDCSSQPLVAIPQELSNNSFAECAKHDPALGEETDDNFAELLSEELKLREAQSTESQQRADMALLEAKKVTSQYQKEADKCNSGMETCEEARAKSEASLLEQKKLTAMWEQRARQKGWKEGGGKSGTQTQGNVQSM